MKPGRMLATIAVWSLLSACATYSGHVTTSQNTGTPGVDDSAGTQQAAAWFDANRDRPTLLRAFLSAMPKGGDIHTHASGAIYAETYIELAARRKLCVDRSTGIIYTDHREPCNAPEIPASQLLENWLWYGNQVDKMSTRNLVFAGRSGHDQFFDAFPKFPGRTRADQIAELVNRAAHQNIAYTEIMLSLGSGITKQYSNSVRWDGNLESTYDELTGKLLKHVPDGIGELNAYERGADQLLGCGTPDAAPGCGVTRRYLLQINRVVSPARVYAQFVYAFELVRADPRIVGLNMVAPEDNRVALNDYDLHMQMLAYLAGHYPEVPVSLHAGELTIGLVPPRYLRDHIRKAVLVAGAKRIGHGVDIFYEDSPFETLEIMRQRDVLVEICLTSNDVILGVKDEEHPFSDYLAAGVPLTLATDDEGVSRIDLSNEYLRAVMTYGLSYRDVKRLARNSISYSFLAGASLWASNRDFAAVDPCAGQTIGSELPTPGCVAFLDSSHKARLQWQLERDFRAFERSEWLRN